MESLMERLFWLGLVVVVVAAGVFWAVTVPAEQSDAEAKKEQYEANVKKIKELAAQTEKVATAAKVKAAEDFREYLKAQRQELEKMWADKDFTKRPRVGPKVATWPTELTKFDTWKSERATEILDEAQKAGLNLYPDFAAVHLFKGKFTGDEREREFRGEYLAIIQELVHQLCSVKGEVARVQMVKREEKEEKVQAGVLSLDGLEVLNNAKRLDRVKAELHAVYVNLAHGAQPPDATAPRLLDGPRAEMRFTTYASLIPKVLQTLEYGRSAEDPARYYGYFGMLRKFDCQRVSDAYPKVADFAFAAPGMKEFMQDPNALKINSRYREAPVEVLVVLDMLSYNPAGPAPKGK